MAKTTLVQSVMLPLSKIEANRGQIVGLPKNPRVIRDAKFQILKKSIEEDPEMTALREILVVEYGDKYVIIGGNMRFRAMQDLGIKEAPCKVIPADTDVEKLKAYTIKDNAGFGEWDWDDLANEWGDEPLSDWGVDVWEAEEEQSEGGDTPEVVEDDFDEEQDPVICRCKRGDVWQLGNHRVMCGDSTSEEDVAKLMGGGIADIAFSSPPYNAGFGANLTKDNGRSKYINGDDDMSQDAYQKFIEKYILMGNKYAKYNFVNIQMLANNKMAIIDTLEHLKNNIADIMIWDKGRSQPAAAANVLNSEFEFVLCFSKKGNRSIGTIPFHGTLKNIVHISPSKNEYAEIHNAVFPIDLPAHFIQHFAKESVIDFFGGTGTTMIAAEQLGKMSFLMELEPHYCDVIIARWEKLTGQTAKLVTN